MPSDFHNIEGNSMKIFELFTNLFKKKASAQYDGAGHGKRLGNWYPSSSSINTLLASSLSTLRTRSHDIVRKNPYAANAIDSIVRIALVLESSHNRRQKILSLEETFKIYG
ncbi:hypothetical protein FACS189449_11630 [Alphaproteobacteria bacterium]|nr:hypothetical protein FACS189449_11630 [Alphaproteobacteria bacterium]